MNVPPDDLVQSFLKAARADKVAVLVVYGLVDDGKPVVRLVSNSDENGTQALIAWLTKIDERGAETAAEALHERWSIFRNPGTRCRVCYGADDERPWADLDDETKHRHVGVVRLVLEAIKQTGRVLTPDAQKKEIAPS